MTWKRVKLKTLLTQPIQNGYSPICPDTPNGKWILALGALNGSGFDATQVKPAPIGDKRVDDFLLHTGDFLVSRSNTLDKVGRAALFKGQIENCAYPDLMMRFRVDESSINPKFMDIFLRSSEAVRHFQRSASGTSASMVKINKTVVENLLIPQPTLAEQAAIADLLSTWDTGIDKIERLIAAKEKRYSWLSRMLLFGNTNSNSVVLKRTLWFTVPVHWEITKIGTVAKEVKATNGSEEDIPVLSCTKYDGLVNSLEYFGKQVFSTDTSTYKVVSRGQFAYATNHIEEGSIGYQNLHDKGLVSPMYTVFETDKSIDDGYLFKVLKTEIFRHIFEISTSASVDRRGSLRWNEFAKLLIPLPPIEEQQQISETLNTARQEINLLKKQIEALRRQKHGLMQKLLTGAWRVRVG